MLTVSCLVHAVGEECPIGHTGHVCRPSLADYRDCVRRWVLSASIHRLSA